MCYRRLEWDSSFFGLHVACLTVGLGMESRRLAELLDRSRADVIYVFVKAEYGERYRAVLEGFSAICYDRKVSYVKEIDPDFALCEGPIEECSRDSDDLLRLAYSSGHLSRFFLDPRFHPHFKRLYGEWVRKSLSHDDYRVFTVSDVGRMQGMVTVSVERGIGRIGLIAIDQKSRGRGMGLDLLRKCESYYNSKDVKICKVITQQANLGACKLYEKAGYHIEDRQDVWHVWKK